MKAIFAYSMAGVCLSALMAPSGVAAQSAEAPAATNVGVEAGVAEDIIVTARRRDERVQDVPAVINAVTAEDIAKLNFRNFTEVQTLVPGLQLDTNANGIGGNARLRGVNFDINASGNNPTVEFYQNDAPITAGVVLQQMYDVGQIEVLRGPQGTLRGRASPSGSITVTTHKPDLGEFGGYLEGTANDIDTRNIQGALNIPVIKGVAGIRVAGLFDRNDLDRVNSVAPAAGARDPRSRTESGRISALIEPADWLRLEGVYQRLDRNFRSYDQVESFNQVNPAAPASPVLIEAEDRRGIQPLPSNTVSQKFDIYNWRAEVAAAGQRLIYQGQHYTQELGSTQTSDRANFFPATANVNQVTASDTKSTSHELRLQNEDRVFDLFDYVVGVFDNKNKTPTNLTQPTVVRLPVAFGGGVAQLVQTPIGRRGNSHEQSVFGNLTAHIGESTELSGGLRAIDYKDNAQLIVNGTLLSNVDQNDDKVIYTASIKHNFTQDFLVYASTGSSYRPGIAIVGDFNIAPSALERSFLNLPAETSKSYEAGFKSSLFDKSLRLNGTFFHQKFKNFPYRLPGTGAFYVNTVALRNAAGMVTGTAQQVATFNFAGAVPVTVNGVEGEASFNISDNWNVGVVASYALGKIKGGTIPCTDLNGDGAPDSVTAAPTLAQLQAAVGANNIDACTVTQRSAFLPPFSATVQSEYTLPFANGMNGFLRGLLSYNGRSQSNPTNAFDDVGSYGLLNAYAGLRGRNDTWEISIFAKNLFDTTKVLSRTDPLSTSYQQLPGAIIGGVPTITGTPTAATFTSSYTGITTTVPQEFGLTFRVRFGSR